RLSYMRPGRRARAAPEDELVTHELSVIFSECAGERFEPGIGRICALRPLPDVAVHLDERALARGACRDGMKRLFLDEIPLDGDAVRGDFPFGFRREPRAGPPGEGVGLEV